MKDLIKKANFKPHLGLFRYNFFSNISTKLWVWISLQLVFETLFFFLCNYRTGHNSYFWTRITWLVTGIILFINYIFFLILNLLNIFKNDVNNGMIVVFLSKPFSRMSLYLNKIISLFVLCIGYSFIFFIYAIILSFFMNSPYQSMIIDINGYLMLAQLTLFFFLTGFILWLKMSQKGLLILFSLMLFLIFPLTAMVVPGISGMPFSNSDSRISDYNVLSPQRLNGFEQYKYLLNKYGKDKIVNVLTNDLKSFFEANFSKRNELVDNEKRKGSISSNFDKDQWEKIRIHLLFTKWNVNKADIIESNSLQEAYDHAVSQVNEIETKNLYPNLNDLPVILGFYLDLLKFAIANETALIEKIKNPNLDRHSMNNFYTPLIFRMDSANKQVWTRTDDFTTIAFNCFLTYSFSFYTKTIDPAFLELTENKADTYNKYDINAEFKTRFVIPNYFNIFRQMLIMWQRPSLTKWKYEMNLPTFSSYISYNFLNNHDFIPCYKKDDGIKRNYFDIEKSGYQFNMPMMYICYLFVGLSFTGFGWLNYRKKDLV